jgi:hypothetical protein
MERYRISLGLRLARADDPVAGIYPTPPIYPAKNLKGKNLEENLTAIFPFYVQNTNFGW